MANQNLELLIIAAKLLRPVLDDLVFVGGCATGLLTDEAAAEVRPTFDVDAIAEITSYAWEAQIRHTRVFRDKTYARSPGHPSYVLTLQGARVICLMQFLGKHFLALGTGDFGALILEPQAYKIGRTLRRPF
jgi:hypothetical protein